MVASPRSLDMGDEYMRSYFDELDTDGSGMLDFGEVKKALRKAGKYAGEGQIQSLLETADKNGDGTIDFDEFKILMALPKEDQFDTLRGAAAEFIGLVLFQFFGGLTSAGIYGNGVVLAVLIYCTAAISGGHLNPAVSFALCITKQIPPAKMAIYWVAQMGGGIVGALCYQSLQLTKGCTTPGNLQLTAGNVFGMEFIATFLLVFTVFGAAVDPRTGAGNFAPLAIGFSLLVAASAIGPFTGAGLNPARTICPAIVGDCWTTTLANGSSRDNYQWAYVLAQLLGAATAGLVYTLVFLNRPDDGAKKAASAFTFMATETKAIRKRLDGTNV